MDDARQLLERAQFRARGKWYLAQQVDAFLEELAVGLEESGRELEELREEERSLRRENARLRQELDAARASQAPPREGSQEAARRICQELERERDGLIQDIKALRRFRESFRQAVEGDAQELLRQVEGLPSQTVL